MRLGKQIALAFVQWSYTWHAFVDGFKKGMHDHMEQSKHLGPRPLTASRKVQVVEVTNHLTSEQLEAWKAFKDDLE